MHARDHTGMQGFSLAVREHRCVVLFILAQVYFASNLWSFGAWKENTEVLAYMVLFCSAWLLVLTLALLVFLGFSKGPGSRMGQLLGAAVPTLLSVPFLVDLHAASTSLHWVQVTVLLPLLMLYYHLGPAQFIKTSCVMIILILLALQGHRAGAAEHQEHGHDPVTLDRQPNVHVIMLDAFTHTAFTHEFMGMENPAADYLAELDDAIYAGAAGFVEATPTKPSWSMLFELGREGGATNHGAFAGHTPSLLATLLRENGYFIQTGFSAAYFGKSKGDYIDHYLTSEQLVAPLICLPGNQSRLLGLCTDFSLRLAAHIGPGEIGGTWPDAVIDRIMHAQEHIERPVFSGYYIYYPIGHTPPKSYTYGDEEALAAYKRHFAEAVRRAHEFLRRIEQLRKRFPDSIFIVAGDHGPRLTRNAEREEVGDRFWVLDANGVALALLNASNLCPQPRRWLVQQRYLTPARMLAAALACDGESMQLVEGFRDNKDFVRFSGAPGLQ